MDKKTLKACIDANIEWFVFIGIKGDADARAVDRFNLLYKEFESHYPNIKLDLPKLVANGHCDTRASYGNCHVGYLQMKKAIEVSEQ